MRNYNIFKAGTIIALLFMCFSTFGQTNNVYKSAYFNGTNYAMGETNLSGFGDNSHTHLTVEAWVKTDTVSSSNTQTIIQAYGTVGTVDFLNIHIYLDTLYASYGSTPVKCYYPADTNWHHVAFTRNTSYTGLDSLTLFIDGSFSATSNNTHVLAGAGAGGVITIGCRNSIPLATTNYFKGHIARVIITDSVLYTGSFTPDCVFDTVGFIAYTDVIKPSTLMVLPLNGNDTAYYQAPNGAHFEGVTNIYTYLTSPCAPVLTFTADTSALDSIVNKATNNNYSYMKGAHASTHYNGWDTSLHTTKVYCPDINYGVFIDSITVYTDTVMNYYSDYFKNTSPHHDTVTLTTTLVNTVNNVDVKVYPIPANNYININAQNFIRAEIVDLTGETYVSSNEKTISVQNLPTGNYLLKIMSLNGYSVINIVIIH